MHHGPGHGTPLLLAAGELRRPVGHAAGEVHGGQQLFGPAAGARLLPPPDQQRHHHVLERGELGQQVVELEDEADLPIAQVVLLLGGQRLILGTVQRDAAAGRFVEGAEEVQQGALARTARADDGDDLATVHREVHMLQHFQQGAVAAPEHPPDARGFEGHAHSYRIASTGFRLAACHAGYNVATVATVTLARTIMIRSSGSTCTGR